ncbi:hypothetical protein [Faecalispora jeddahensis]|uniref:hypothetical protein n=1 Tax=Faecalispora jeddahensis TaxID=1414721 RepID=UPI00145C038B|nr:hypothetical protein [Faecalispora jeddahensis]MBE6742809.1 hypothetical protein [Oscillospiraceae bacterium]
MKQIIDLILNSKYEEAYYQMKHMSLEEKWKLIGDEMYDENPLVVYTFLLYLISKDSNEAEWHFNSYLYLVFYNPFFDDSMQLAAWHLKNAMLLEPLNIEFKKQAISTLFYYPEQLFSDGEFRQFALDVLAQEPNNEHAKKIIESSIN